MKDFQDLQLIREYKVSVDRLWRAVTAPDQVSQWFGTEGVRLDECHADFTRPGPWLCVMVGLESGQRFKVTGQVTHVKPPENGGAGSVGFTWAWHDDEDRRGAESHVTFTVESAQDGARFILDHRDLPDADIAGRHEQGWNSTLRRLDEFIN